MSEQEGKPTSINVPNDPWLRTLVESGYGEIEVTNHGEGRSTTGSLTLTLEEMEAMGAEERERLGIEYLYQFALDHQANDATGSTS